MISSRLFVIVGRYCRKPLVCRIIALAGIMVRRLDRSIALLPLVVVDVFKEIGMACFGQYPRVEATSYRRLVIGADQVVLNCCNIEF